MSFGEVTRLDADALRALLVGGEAPERVWAAWALGLRHDRTFARELRATTAEEPDAGVRRHLLVVLAGAGEAPSIMTLALHDPDERVRATALQYLARLARPDDVEANNLLERELSGGTPPLRLGCIAGLRADAPAALWNAVEDCVASPDPELRWAAYEAIMRQGKSARPAPALARVFVNVEAEPAARRSALALLHERSGAQGLLDLCNDHALAARVLPDIVEALNERAVRLPWATVEPLLARFPAADRLHRVLKLLVDGGEGPARAALLRLFVEDRRDPEESIAIREEIVYRLRRALDDNHGPLDESERALRQALIEYVEATAAHARRYPDAYEIDADYWRAGPDGSFDPLVVPWFCEEEREILTRLAALEVH